MADVWLGILNRFVEKLFNVKGGPTVVDVEPTVRLSLPVLLGAEVRYLQGWNRYARSRGDTGGAGQHAALMIHNPQGSGVVAVIERLGMRTGGVATLSQCTISYQVGPGGIVDYGTVLVPIPLDARTSPGSSMIVSSTINGTSFVVNLILAAMNSGLETQVITTHDQEITLLPGSALQTLDETVAENMQTNLIWRERPLEPSEFA